jgi:hypothetical protein
MVNESTRKALLGAFGAGVPLLILFSLMFCCMVRVTLKEEAERKERLDPEWGKVRDVTAENERRLSLEMAKIRGTAPSSASCASSVPVPFPASIK